MNPAINLDDNVKSILKTHSSATLKNVKTVKEPQPDGRIKVFCYLSKQESDEGYLFLLIDFTERDPLIYVRSWQPNEWNDSSLVRTANFRIYK